MLWDMLTPRRPNPRPLGHPGLLLALKHEVTDLQTLCSLLQTSRVTSEALFAHCCGSVPLECKPGNWLHVIGWVDIICCGQHLPVSTLCGSQEVQYTYI
jgi:hypothetical protein